jgi:hypothetical protein
MQNRHRIHPGDRRAVQIVQARTTRDRIRCNTTQCRTRGSRRRQRRRLKQAPPATPPAPRPRGPVPARAAHLENLAAMPCIHGDISHRNQTPGIVRLEFILSSGRIEHSLRDRQSDSHGEQVEGFSSEWDSTFRHLDPASTYPQLPYHCLSQSS